MIEIAIFWIVIPAIWLVFYISKRVNIKLKYCMPFINLLFWLIYLAKNICSYSVNEATFAEKVRLFFQNDSSMIYTFFIFPNIMIGTIIPLILIVIIKIMEIAVKNK